MLEDGGSTGGLDISKPNPGELLPPAVTPTRLVVIVRLVGDHQPQIHELGVIDVDTHSKDNDHNG
jgi:hypothetical protein